MPLPAVLSGEQKRETSEFRKRRFAKAKPQSPPKGSALEPDGSPHLGSPIIFAPKTFAKEQRAQEQAEDAARRRKLAEELERKSEKRTLAMELAKSKGFSSDMGFFGIATPTQRPHGPTQVDASFGEQRLRSHARGSSSQSDFTHVSKEAYTEGTARFISGTLSTRVTGGTEAARSSLRSSAGARPRGHRSEQVDLCAVRGNSLHLGSCFLAV
jgi:hypothetical protein